MDQESEGVEAEEEGEQEGVFLRAWGDAPAKEPEGDEDQQRPPAQTHRAAAPAVEGVEDGEAGHQVQEIGRAHV